MSRLMIKVASEESLSKKVTFSDDEVQRRNSTKDWQRKDRHSFMDDDSSRNDSSSSENSENERKEKENTIYLTVPTMRPPGRRKSSILKERGKQQTEHTDVPEHQYERSLSPSPSADRHLVNPSTNGGSGHFPAECDGASDCHFNKVDHPALVSMNSLNSIGAHPKWAESDQAKSSLIAVLSALYAMVLVILSLAFEVSIAVVDVNINKYDIFYIYLYSVSLMFFAYCEFYLLRPFGCFCNLGDVVNKCRDFLRSGPDRRKLAAPTQAQRPEKEQAETDEFLRKRRISMVLKRRASHSASSAGSLYLRMGCVVFGVVGLIMKGLQLFAVFDHRTASECFISTWVVETVLAAIFLFVQMFFIFQNSKLIIHRFKTIGRLGAMHLVATNLCTWIRCLVEEQMTIMHEINEGIYHKDSTSSKHNDHSKDSNSLNHSKNTSTSSDACNYARYSINNLIADVEPFMTTCIIEYSLICAAVMYILWRNIGHVPRMRTRQRKQRFHVDCSASTHGLFLGLLFMVYTIVSMVIFFTKVRSGATKSALCVFYTSYLVLFAGSITASSVGMYRMRELFYAPGHTSNIILLDDILLVVGLVGQLVFSTFAVVPLKTIDFVGGMILACSLLRMVQVLLQTVFIIFAQRLATLTPEMQDKNPGREMVTLLIMNNLSLFLMNTFETHKAGSIPHLFDAYGEAVWMVIAHSTIPLCIFYRFHSTVCLAEIWKQVYRVKDGPQGK